MPYPAGKHGPGHYVGDAGIVPPPIVPDPVGSLLVWHQEDFAGGGLRRTYVTSDGASIGFIQSPPSTTNPGRGSLIASDIAFMAGMSDNTPPTPPQEFNTTTADGADWFDNSGAVSSPWNLDVSPSFVQMFFFRVAGLFCIFKTGTDDYFTSPDGVIWTMRTGPWASPYGPFFNSYGSDGVLDYLVTQGFALRSTVDGINFVTIEPSLSGGRFIFAGSNGGDKYWLFGNSGASSRVESSLDGTAGTWARDLAAEASLDAAGLVPFNNPFDVAYSNSIRKFVIKFNIAGAGSTSNRLAASADGINWTNPGSVFNSVGAVRYSGTLGMFVATSGSGTEAALLLSGNGTTWSKNVYAGFSALAGFPSSDLLVSF